jgi:hypothetical protein
VKASGSPEEEWVVWTRRRIQPSIESGSRRKSGESKVPAGFELNGNTPEVTGFG